MGSAESAADAVLHPFNLGGVMAFFPGVSLILGGARSGKSSFAADLARQSSRQKIYLATCQVWEDDNEMEQRVALHKERRGDDWQLVEEPLELAKLLATEKVIDGAEVQNLIGENMRAGIL